MHSFFLLPPLIWCNNGIWQVWLLVKKPVWIFRPDHRQWRSLYLDGPHGGKLLYPHQHLPLPEGRWRQGLRPLCPDRFLIHLHFCTLWLHSHVSLPEALGRSLLQVPPLRPLYGGDRENLRCLSTLSQYLTLFIPSPSPLSTLSPQLPNSRVH